MSPPQSLDFFSTMGLAMGGFTGRDAPPRGEAWSLPRAGLAGAGLVRPNLVRVGLPTLRPRLLGLLGSMLPPGF